MALVVTGSADPAAPEDKRFPSYPRVPAMGLRSVLEGIPWWGYGAVGVCYLVFVGVRLFEGSSLSTPGLAVRVGLGWWLIIVSYLKYYGYV
jgi:hypothetical protein